MLLRPLLVVLLAVLAAALAAPAAHASEEQISVMMDDDQLIYRSDATRDRALDRMAHLGVDYVRVTVLWSVVADRARNTKRKDRRFRKLGADHPRAYPTRNWDRFDNLVRAAQARGIGVYFNVTGPGPSWGHAKAPASERRVRHAWMPKPRQFKLFVRAVGTRYSGRYRDENHRPRRLPRVSYWSLWNEPNQGGWLAPQWYRGRLYSPMLFRKLYVAGYEALVGTKHAGDIILLGETAPLGVTSRRTTSSGVYPVTFIRELFCVDGAGRPRNGLGCGDFKRHGPLKATAFAHHPYTKYNGPTQPDASPLALTMANLGSLTALLDQVAQKTGRIQENLPIALTEFGWETKPPDRHVGVSLEKQTEWLNIGELLAWANPRVIAQTQFLLRDVKPLRKYAKGSKAYWSTYQSGLFFSNGRPKPAADAYRMPFAVFPGRRGAGGGTDHGFWGQLRFRPNRSTDLVSLQFRASGSREWSTLGDPVVARPSRNYFTAVREVPGRGEVRAVWVGRESPFVATTRTIKVGG